ncbi:PIN domain-containing protein [Candidatus Woesearchaeota archaeon]|nr:PIN domain-containing protein [Candidatus Woesearchaeota archaeon]
MNEIYFFDTYAIIEMIKGNENYSKFKNAKMITAILNLIELHYALLKDFNEDKANYFLEKYSNYVIGLDIGIIKEANKFRLKNIKKKISTADSIGYVLSIKNGIKFLTGDQEFEGLENVEFVK